ncbi:MAG: isopenicillin N synthase family oxygenase [Acidimicrobiales bacterium]|nr:isopenicillin N synthase family oxygenase [Acidimicrobiales bacterium]
MSVPVIDLNPYFDGSAAERAAVARRVDETCRRIGFLVVTGHRVPGDAVAAMEETSHAFFALPLEEKMTVAGPPGDTFVAYSPLGDPRPGDDPYAPSRPNLREVFHTSRYDTPAEALAHGYPAEVVGSLPPNLWPARPAGFEAAWKRYFAEMESLASRVLGLFAVALGLPEDHFEPCIDRHLGNLAANCYVEQPEAPEPGRLRIPAHVDFSTMTILHQDGGPGGLQVHQRDVGWVDVPPLAGSYVLNVGDVLARWTNDRWVATPHRVLNPEPRHAATRRLSIPFFHLPNHDAVIEPLPTCVGEDNPARYEPVRAGEWIMTRRARLVAAS